MGDEEARVIVPAMQRARRLGIACDGPFPADSFFIERVKHYQLILAMYHDQGLIAVKPAFPRASVNVTLACLWCAHRWIMVRATTSRDKELPAKSACSTQSRRRSSFWPGVLLVELGKQSLCAL